MCAAVPAGNQKEDDIAAQLGVGSAAADAELDRLKDAAEAEIMARGNLIGRFAKLLSDFCHLRYNSAHSLCDCMHTLSLVCVKHIYLHKSLKRNLGRIITAFMLSLHPQ